MRLNANRTVSGILRGFDPYMNLVLDDCVEECSTQQKFNIGMVVCESTYSVYLVCDYNLLFCENNLAWLLLAPCVFFFFICEFPGCPDH